MPIREAIHFLYSPISFSSLLLLSSLFSACCWNLLAIISSSLFLFSNSHIYSLSFPHREELSPMLRQVADWFMILFSSSSQAFLSSRMALYLRAIYSLQLARSSSVQMREFLASSSKSAIFSFSCLTKASSLYFLAIQLFARVTDFYWLALSLAFSYLSLLLYSIMNERLSWSSLMFSMALARAISVLCRLTSVGWSRNDALYSFSLSSNGSVLEWNIFCLTIQFLSTNQRLSLGIKQYIKEKHMKACIHHINNQNQYHHHQPFSFFYWRKSYQF